MELQTRDFNYELPPELIAETPAARRDASRLMVLDRSAGTIQHDCFASIGGYLNAGDLLVANRSKVIPARLSARKATGAAVELLLTRSLAPDRWLALARPSRRLRAGMALTVERSPLSAVLERRAEEGQWVVRFEGAESNGSGVLTAGTLPLPPYIRNPNAPLDRYQTVYADRDGSIAAPTAGLHFSTQLLERIQASGIRLAFVTLHVGMGTFKPVTAERVTDHRMHPEWGEVSEEAAAAAREARRAGHRIVAVGTTTTRLLESAAADGQVRAFRGETDRFIYPGYRFQAVDAMVTNFHLPRSTLLMLACAFAGREFVLSAYAEAVRQEYRFYSFGDAMLIV